MTDQTNQQSTRVAVVDPDNVLAFDWGSIAWLISGQKLADSQMTLGYVEIRPSRANFRHYHPNCDEVLYVLEGEIDHGVAGERFLLKPGMAIHIPMGVPHNAINHGTTTARMIVAYSSGDRQTVTLDEGQE